VAVLTTGSELIGPGEPSRGGGVYDANANLLATLAEADGAVTTVLPCLPDDPERVLDCLLAAAVTYDVVVTAGGISAGAYEVVRQALEPLGTVAFSRVAMTPGSPQGRGRILATPVLALPGNPTAALVSYLVFGRPLLRLARGLASKGLVENLVGYAKTDLMVPLGVIEGPLQPWVANTAAVGWCTEVNAVRHPEIYAVPAERLAETELVLLRRCRRCGQASAGRRPQGRQALHRPVRERPLLGAQGLGGPAGHVAGRRWAPHGGPGSHG